MASSSSLPSAMSLENRGAQVYPTLTSEQIARILPFGSEVRFEDGVTVFEQGQEAIPFYVVLEGGLDILHPRNGVDERIVLHGPGNFAGEVNLLNERRSLVRGRARGALRMLRVELPRFRTLIQTDSELSEMVMRAFILRRVSLLSAGRGDAVVVGSQDSAATLRVRAFLVRNGHPYQYLDVQRDPDVQQMLDRFHVTVADIPILICRDSRVLRNPTNAEVAECLGFNASLQLDPVRDVVVCGAGPGGLAAAVYGASEGLDVLVIETIAPGGQAGSLQDRELPGLPNGDLRTGAGRPRADPGREIRRALRDRPERRATSLR